MTSNEFDLATERRLYCEGIALFNDGQFFEAHETWEECWKSVLDRRREQFYRAIIRGAVTLELLRRGRAVGVRQVFVDCVNTFEGLPPVFMGLDIADFLSRMRHAIAAVVEDLETRHVPIDPSRLFAIELRYDPFEASLNGEGAAPIQSRRDGPE